MKLLNLKSAFQKNLSTQIFIKIITLIIIASVTFTVIFIRHQSKTLTDTLIKEGLSLAELASYNATLGVYSENPDFLENILEGVMKREGVLSCDIFSLEGKLLSRKGRPDGINMKNETVMELINASKSPHHLEKPNHFEFWATVISSSKNTSEESLFYGTDNKSKRVIGFIRIDIGKEIIKKSYNKLITRGFVIGAVFLLVGTVIAVLFANNVTSPLNRLRKGVQAIGKGDFDTQLPIETKDEIGELATTINNMASLLKTREEEKEKLMEQLHQSQRLEAIGTFAGGIVHDFNNIMTIIQSNMEVAKMKAPDYIKTYLEKSLEAIERGDDITKRLLNFTNIESAIIRDAVNMEMVVQDTLRLFDNNIKFRADIEPNLWRALGDAGQIQQVILNLITNARDAISECGKDRDFAINVSLINIKVTEDYCKNNPKASEGDFIMLSVQDNGCGMDKQTERHIFEPFYTTKDIDKGTGLGLSTVYGIIRQHSGWIDVQSEVGEGSTFNVYLPKFKGEIPVTESKPVKESEHSGGSETILLVDDEENILSAIKEKLESLGYKILLANDGEVALEMLKRHRGKIDLIILDYVMPRMSGLEVLQHIRRDKLETKMLIFSGKDLSQYSHVLEDIDVIRKPCNLNFLINKIRETLGSEKELPFKTSINRVKFYCVEEQTIPYKEVLTDISTAYDIFRHIANEPRENFIAVYLDSQNKIIVYDNLSTGTTNKVTVFPKEIVRTAIATNAVSVILLHNHPSGDLSPSNEDIILTASILQACALVDVKVLDHLIISEEGYLSFSQEGLLEQ